MPRLLWQVLSTSSPSNASTSDLAALPDDLPGQSNTAAVVAAAAAAAAGQGLSAAAEPFSFFSTPHAHPAAAASDAAVEAAEIAALPALRRPPPRPAARSDDVAAWGAARTGHRPAKGLVNEVVCGAMMLAYERSGRWSQACAALTLLSPAPVSLREKAHQWQEFYAGVMACPCDYGH